ncbi:MAG: hypothetical protein NZ108_02605, partial [Bacteroidia bacterium]|nr:hypothetical protein [Bacteroidia bacterium]
MTGVLADTTILHSQFEGKRYHLYLANGILEEICSANETIKPGYTIWQAGGYVSAGWVDTHCFLMDPGYEHRESWDTLQQATVRGGFTDVIIFPQTNPIPDTVPVLLQFLGRKGPARLHFTAPLTIQQYGKQMAPIGELQHAGAIAFSDGNRYLNSDIQIRTLEYAQAFSQLIILYPQDSTFQGIMHEG